MSAGLRIASTIVSLRQDIQQVYLQSICSLFATVCGISAGLRACSVVTELLALVMAPQLYRPLPVALLLLAVLQGRSMLPIRLLCLQQLEETLGFGQDQP